jgi:hypothetical protein
MTAEIQPITTRIDSHIMRQLAAVERRSPLEQTKLHIETATTLAKGGVFIAQCAIDLMIDRSYFDPSNRFRPW